MGGVALLTAARSAGLSVHRNGPRLVIRGPRSADVTARRLIERKGEVMDALALVQEWQREVATMRAGDDPDWRSWTPTCRATWAGWMTDGSGVGM